MIEVTHRGYTITFNENSDEWYCRELSGKSYSAPKLSTIKASIDRMLLSVRKKSAITCYEVSGGHSRDPSKTEAQIVEFITTKNERDYSGKAKPPVHIVASVAQRRGSAKASRREVSIADLMPDTPEAHAAFDRLVKATEREVAAHKETLAALNAIPRVTFEMITDLVKLADEKPEGEGA